MPEVEGEVVHETLKEHLAKAGIKDPLEAFGFRVRKKKDQPEDEYQDLDEV